MDIHTFPRPIIRPIPVWMAGVDTPRVSLDGTWKFTTLVPEEFHRSDPTQWANAVVPGDLTVQGFEILPHREYPYRRLVSIPRDFASCRVFLRSEAGYALRRLWVNETYIGEHSGAFSVWDADITPYIIPGEPAWITLSVTADDGRTAIEYHHTRGLVRSVSLYAVPRMHIARLITDTDLDERYQDARLLVTAICDGMEECSSNTVSMPSIAPDTVRPSCELRLSLCREGESILPPVAIDLSAGEVTQAIDVPAPLKWDGEHPNLYELHADLYVNGQWTERVTRAIGFRKIEYDDDGITINGEKLTLRGVNWHQDHPFLGEVPDTLNDERSLRLLMDANVNFIRTSHYPQTDEILDLCDRLGLYVEDETSVFFIDDQQIGYGTQHDPAYTQRYMEQFASMIEKDRSHASVILWSLGNESTWGFNMRHEYEYVKAVDPSRPVIWSYPHEVDEGETPRYDLFSVHYQKIPYCHGQKHKPELCDEFCHITHMNPDLLSYDPALRDFYGEELRYLFEQMHAAPRNAGGAIWYAEDTMFMRPDGCYSAWPTFNQNWGIIDIWKRPKPEWWNVKKEYSPVHINRNRKRYPLPVGGMFTLELENRFNHTRLSETLIGWRCGDQSGCLSGPDVGPGEVGVLHLPVGAVLPGDAVGVKVYRHGSLVDAYRFVFGEPVPPIGGNMAVSGSGMLDSYDRRSGGSSGVPSQSCAPALREDRSFIWVEGADFSIQFFKRTAQILSGTYKGVEILTGGPMLNLGHPGPIAPLKPTLRCERAAGEVRVWIDGDCGGVQTHFCLAIDHAGRIETTYTLDAVPDAFITALGVSYLCGRSMDRLRWERDGLWSYYPDDYLCGNEGTAHKRRIGGAEEWAKHPDWTWALDEKDFSNADGAGDRGERGTNRFRCSKTNLYRAELADAATGVRVIVEGDGTGSVQTNAAHNGFVCLCINEQWSFHIRGWVARTKISRKVSIASGHTGRAVMRLSDREPEPLAYRELALEASVPKS